MNAHCVRDRRWPITSCPCTCRMPCCGAWAGWHLLHVDFVVFNFAHFLYWASWLCSSGTSPCRASASLHCLVHLWRACSFLFSQGKSVGRRYRRLSESERAGLVAIFCKIPLCLFFPLVIWLWKETCWVQTSREGLAGIPKGGAFGR